ncbi:MAG: DUF1326 domain-containing protein [Lentisphaerae bacterium]|nr:DUF1326 domain-containing protein [Lentisphaerota bacterium]
MNGVMREGLCWVIAGGVAWGSVATARADDKTSYQVSGLYTEACSCHAPCGCELITLNMSCNGVGAMVLKAGTFGGADLSGAKLAYAGHPGEWVKLYVDAENEETAVAAEKFARALFAPWGTVESVKRAHVDIDGSAGRYMVKVNDGTTMQYESEAVLGADGKNPIEIRNVKNELNKTFKQGLGVSCSFSDDNRSFTIEKGRNAYFNDAMDASGSI